MIRLFKVYYPLRTLVFLVGEAMIVWISFVLGTMLQNREDSWLLLNVEDGYLKILAVTAVVLLLSHWFDLYDSSSLGAKWDQIFRLLLVLGFVALALSAMGFIYPELLPGNGSALAGLIILTFTLVGLAGRLFLDGEAALPARAGLRFGYGRARAAAGEGSARALRAGD